MHMQGSIFLIFALILILILSIFPGVMEVFGLLSFIFALIGIISEIYKLVYGNKLPNSSKNVPTFLFGDKNSLFFKESLKDVEGYRKFWVWFSFLFYVGYVIWYFITRIIM
jgi:hypothetical protein